MEPVIKDSKLSEVYELTPHLRLDDLKELKASNLTSLQALKEGFRISEKTYSVFADKKIIGMFGYSIKNMPKGYTNVWFLGSNEIEKYPLFFIKEGKKFINKLKEQYKIFHIVYSKNITHIKYIECMGLFVDKNNPIFHPETNEKFYPFYS